MRGGGLIAHATGTVAGVAAAPAPQALARLRRFKQRRGPFLLLADSARTAWRLARRRPMGLRRIMRECWPGPVTLAYAARPPSAGRAAAGLVRQGRIAVRVDADAETRLLCRLCGGLLLSSSLNRRGHPTAMPARRLRWRLARHLAGRLPPPAGWKPGAPSAIRIVTPRTVRTLRRRPAD